MIVFRMEAMMRLRPSVLMRVISAAKNVWHRFSDGLDERMGVLYPAGYSFQQQFDFIRDLPKLAYGLLSCSVGRYRMLDLVKNIDNLPDFSFSG